MTPSSYIRLALPVLAAVLNRAAAGAQPDAVPVVPILEVYPGLAFDPAAPQGYAGFTLRLPGTRAGAG